MHQMATSTTQQTTNQQSSDSDWQARRKRVAKDAAGRFPGIEMKWVNGYFVFAATGLTVDGTPYIPKGEPTKPDKWARRSYGSTSVNRHQKPYIHKATRH